MIKLDLNALPIGCEDTKFFLNKKEINFIEKDNNNLAHLTQILICTGEFRNVK